MLNSSILGPLLFLIYINHLTIKYTEVHHFTGDTTLLNLQNCVKSTNKQVNYDVTSLKNWMKRNKTFFDIGKLSLCSLPPKKTTTQGFENQI